MLFLVISVYMVPDGCALCSPYCKKAKQAIFSIVPVDEVEVVEVGNQALFPIIHFAPRFLKLSSVRSCKMM
jgi:hypothetical protein